MATGRSSAAPSLAGPPPTARLLSRSETNLIKATGLLGDVLRGPTIPKLPGRAVCYPVMPVEEGMALANKMSLSCLPPEAVASVQLHHDGSPCKQPPGPPLRWEWNSPVSMTSLLLSWTPHCPSLQTCIHCNQRCTSCLSLPIYLSLFVLLGHFVCRAVEMRTSKLNIWPDVKALLVTTLLCMYM